MWGVMAETRDDEPETYWSEIAKARRTKHEPELLEKAIRLANFSEAGARQPFLAAPVAIEACGAAPGQRIWVCTALRALTETELLKLHRSLMATAKECLADGGDYTPADVRAQLPHIYQDSPSDA